MFIVIIILLTRHPVQPYVQPETKSNDSSTTYIYQPQPSYWPWYYGSYSYSPYYWYNWNRLYGNVSYRHNNRVDNRIDNRVDRRSSINRTISPRNSRPSSPRTGGPSRPHARSR